MRLTKLQRYTAYIIMREELCDEWHAGLCSVYNQLTNDQTWRSLSEIFPELFSKRTNRYAGTFSFWFASYKERVEALNQCIAETHPDIIKRSGS